MKLVFIRHGQTVWNVEDIVNGHTDDPLTADWIQMAKDLGLSLRAKKIDAFYSSDSIRARDTAMYIKEFSGWENEIVLDKRLRERHNGIYEWESQEKMRQDRRSLWLGLTDFLDSCGGIETTSQVIERWKDWFDEVESNGFETICVVSHGAFIRYVTAYLLNVEPEEYLSKFDSIKNCGVVVLEIIENRVKLVHFMGRKR